MKNVLCISLFITLIGYHYHTQAQTPNSLSTEEKNNGWHLLFDGKTFGGLHKLANAGWEIKQGSLMATPIPHGKQMDIVTEKEFSDFELVFEFSMSQNTNSGVKYLVRNDFPDQKGMYLGLEYQILDDQHFIYPERGNLRSLGSLYDLIAADPKKIAKPFGEWNAARIRVNGSVISHWLNGHKVVEYDRKGSTFKALVQESKYKDLKDFGKAKKGYILFQNEGTPIAFRNIKIRPL